MESSKVASVIWRQTRSTSAGSTVPALNIYAGVTTTAFPCPSDMTKTWLLDINSPRFRKFVFSVEQPSRTKLSSTNPCWGLLQQGCSKRGRGARLMTPIPPGPQKVLKLENSVVDWSPVEHHGDFVHQPGSSWRRKKRSDSDLLLLPKSSGFE